MVIDENNSDKQYKLCKDCLYYDNSELKVPCCTRDRKKQTVLSLVNGETTIKQIGDFLVCEAERETTGYRFCGRAAIYFVKKPRLVVSTQAVPEGE